MILTSLGNTYTAMRWMTSLLDSSMVEMLLLCYGFIDSLFEISY